jgi:hypothetical protein
LKTIYFLKRTWFLYVLSKYQGMFKILQWNAMPRKAPTLKIARSSPRNSLKIIFCCYHVQISLSMSQQTQSDIFHTKMLQNALWCQITWSKCMLCNILEYCSQTLDIHNDDITISYIWSQQTAAWWNFLNP